MMAHGSPSLGEGTRPLARSEARARLAQKLQAKKKNYSLYPRTHVPTGNLCLALMVARYRQQ